MICFMKANRNSENLIVRESIFFALMQLMEKKKFNDITITEITNRAGVSRMSYYRNYVEKKEIILSYMDELFETYWENIHSKPQDDFQSACLYFNYFRENKKLLFHILESGLTQFILEKHNLYLQTIFKDLYNHVTLESTKEKYVIDFLSGGLFKTLISWAEGGMQESNEYMAKIVCELMEL